MLHSVQLKQLTDVMADACPEWKKPADVMKLRRRKSLCTDLHTLRTATPPTSRLSLDTCPLRTKAQKRKNPFACSSSSKTKGNEDEGADIGESDGVADAQLNRAEVVPTSNCLLDVLVSSFIWTLAVLLVASHPEPSGRRQEPVGCHPDAVRGCTMTAASDRKMPTNLAAVRRH